MRTWTETGLKVAQLPKPLWAKLEAFYQANRGKAVEDRLDPKEVGGFWVMLGVCVDGEYM